MLLPRTAAYALRVLTVLVHAPREQNLTTRELSERCGVPADYLSKVLRRLAKAGVVHASRGQGGGFRLGQSLERVSFQDVFDALRVDLGLGECVFRPGPCDPALPCMLHDAWSRLHQCVGDWAAKTTLADLEDPGQ